MWERSTQRYAQLRQRITADRGVKKIISHALQIMFVCESEFTIALPETSGACAFLPPEIYRVAVNTIKIRFLSEQFCVF